MSTPNLTNAVTIVEVVDSRDLPIHCVLRTEDGVYHVVSKGQTRHTPCTADDALRALANYLQSAVFELERIKFPSGD